MNQHRFAAVTRSLTDTPSRRHLLRGLAGLGLGRAVARLPRAATARKKRRRKKARPNAFGCLDVGAECKSAAQCCSGICRGKKGKSRCVAHDSGLCTLQQDSCGPGGNFVCDPEDKEPYLCVVTTGRGAFCGDFSDPPVGELCRSCRRDRDCQDEFGPGAACIILFGQCPEYCTSTDGTACVPAAPVP